MSGLQDRPTGPGWWWWREDAGHRWSDRPIRVASLDGELLQWSGVGDGWHDPWAGQWLGPIPDPEQLAAGEAEKARLEEDRRCLDAIQEHVWKIEISDYRGGWWYVGPLGIEGKPWGVGPTIRDAIRDAIAAVNSITDTPEDEEARP